VDVEGDGGAVLNAQEALEPALTTEAIRAMPDERNRRRGRSSRRKGACAERELASELTIMFRTEVSRGGRMYQSGSESPDILGLIGLHVECKRRETVSLPSALRQAADDCRHGECPVVMHRGNRQGWMCTVSLADLPRLARTVSRLLPDEGTVDAADRL
jgi:hypothetical protein